MDQISYAYKGGQNILTLKKQSDRSKEAAVHDKKNRRFKIVSIIIVTGV